MTALRREMGVVGALLVTLAGLSPGIGVFIVGPDLIRAVGSGAFLAVLAAGGVGIFVAAIYGELGSAFPHAGGEYAIAGRLLGPRFGFAMLALNLTGLSVALALSSLGVATYLGAVLPGLPTHAIAMPAILGAVAIAACSIRTNATVTGLLVAAEILALAVTAWLGAAQTQPGAIAARLLPPLAAHGAGGLAPVGLGALALATISGIYALNGYGSAIFFGEEMHDAAAHIARVVYLALIIGALTVALPLLAVVLGAGDPAHVFAAASPLSAFLTQAAGPRAAAAIGLSAAAAIFNAMIAIALSGGRQLFAAARDGVLPGAASALFARLHPRFGSPWNATLAYAAIAVPLSLVPLKLLVIFQGNGNLATYATLSLAAIAGRRSGRTRASRSPMWLYPLPPLIVLVALLAMLAASLADRETGRPALIATLLTLTAGVLYSRALLARRPDLATRFQVPDAAAPARAE